MAQSIINTCLLFKSFTHNKLYTDMKTCEQFLLFLSPWAHALARWSTVLVVWTHLLIRNKTYKWIKQLLLPRGLTTANQRLKEQLTFTLAANICEGESCLTGECSNNMTMTHREAGQKRRCLICTLSPVLTIVLERKTTTPSGWQTVLRFL